MQNNKDNKKIFLEILTFLETVSHKTKNKYIWLESCILIKKIKNEL